jgi:hypothetical protein
MVPVKELFEIIPPLLRCILIAPICIWSLGDIGGAGGSKGVGGALDFDDGPTDDAATLTFKLSPGNSSS